MPAQMIRVADYFPALRQRLDTDRMAGFLNGRRADGRGRIYTLMDNYGEPEGPEALPWGRVVVVTPDNLWTSGPDDTFRLANVLIRSEFNNAGNPDGIRRALEGAQDEAFQLLQNWAPGPFTRTQTALAFYLYREPQASPQWDAPRMLWFLSSEYRFQAAAA